VEQIDQATKTKWVTVINTSKSRKTTRERKREHEICLPSSVQYLT